MENDEKQPEWIALFDLSHSLGVTRTSVRAIVAKAGIQPHRVITPMTRGQGLLAITRDEAQALLRDRLESGYSLQAGVPDPVRALRVVDTDSMYTVYTLLVVALDPDRHPARVWVGGSDAPLITLRGIADLFDHTRQTVAASWQCRREWLDAGRAAVVGVDGRSIGLPGWHVYSLDGGLPQAINRGDTFFEQMPPLKTPR